jgi:RNA polymerase sigma-70 factor (ECF subfamily)
MHLSLESDGSADAPVRALIDRAKRRDRPAFDELAQSLRDELRDIAQRKMAGPRFRSQLSADDVVQEALLEAWKAIESFAGQAPAEYRCWLVVILHHTVDRTMRSALAQKRNPGPAGLVAVMDGSTSSPAAVPAARDGSPSSAARRKEFHERVWEVLNRLDDPYRQILCLRYFEELPFKEIERQTGLTPGAVQRQYRTALKRFQELFGDDTSSV